MKRIIITAIATICVAVATQAQSLKIGPSVDVGLPINMGDVYTVAAGAGLNARYALPVLSALELTAGVEYRRFLVKSEYKDMDVKDPQYIPIRVGARYNLPLPFSLYGKLDGGVILSLQEKLDDGLKEPMGYMISPGIGTKLGPLDVELRYEGWISGKWDGIDIDAPNTGVVGLKFAFFF